MRMSKHFRTSSASQSQIFSIYFDKVRSVIEGWLCQFGTLWLELTLLTWTRTLLLNYSHSVPGVGLLVHMFMTALIVYVRKLTEDSSRAHTLDYGCWWRLPVVGGTRGGGGVGSRLVGRISNNGTLNVMLVWRTHTGSLQYSCLTFIVQKINFQNKYPQGQVGF